MGSPDFSTDNLKIDPTTVNGWIANAKAGHSGQTPTVAKEKFLAGPIPLIWLKQAAAQRGQALAVGLALWFLRGCTKRKTVRLTRQTLELFGVERKPGYRGLKALEVAGLVKAERHVGRSPVVTLCSPL